MACSSSNMFFLPQASEDAMNFEPLLALFPVRLTTVFLEGVIFALAAGLGLTPAGFNPAAPLHTVQDGIEHAIGPFEFAARAILDFLDNGVTVALALFEQGKDEGFGRSSHKFPTHHSGTIHSSIRYVK